MEAEKRPRDLQVERWIMVLAFVGVPLYNCNLVFINLKMYSLSLVCVFFGLAMHAYALAKFKDTTILRAVNALFLITYFLYLALIISAVYLNAGN